MISTSLTSHFVHLSFSWFNQIIFLCFLIYHWVSLKQLFSVNWAHHRSPCLWNRLVKNYYDSLVIQCFHDFFAFLRVLWCWLCIWSSTHLLQSLPTAFQRKTPCVSPGGDSEAFSGLLWIHLPCASCSLKWQNSYACLLSLNPETHQAKCCQIPFLPSKMALKLKFVVFPGPADLSYLPVRAHCTCCLPKFVGNAYREPARVGGDVGEAC